MKCWECNKEYNNDKHPKLCETCRYKQFDITIKITKMAKNEKELLKYLKRKFNTMERNYIISSYEITDIKMEHE